LVLLTAIVLLVLGWVLSITIGSGTVPFATADGAVTLQYPASWVTGAGGLEGTVLEAYDVKALSQFHPAFRLRISSLREGQSLFDAATALSIRRGRTVREYRELSSEETTLSGKPALRVSYGYVSSPSARAGAAALPIIVRATDVLVERDGQLLIFTTESEPGLLSRYQSSFDRILRSIRLK
jgi:hypothetical protein